MRKMMPEAMAIQCRMVSERPTIMPARLRVGSTEKAVCATTGKKIRPPIQTIRERNMRKRRKDMVLRVSHTQQEGELVTPLADEGARSTYLLADTFVPR